MTDHGPLAAKYIEAVTRLHSGDNAGYATCWSEGCEIRNDNGTVQGREAWVQRCIAARDQGGWVRQEITASAEEGGIATLFGRNYFSDGRSFPIGGVMRFNSAGEIVMATALGGLGR